MQYFVFLFQMRHGDNLWSYRNLFSFMLLFLFILLRLFYLFLLAPGVVSSFLLINLRWICFGFLVLLFVFLLVLWIFLRLSIFRVRRFCLLRMKFWGGAEIVKFADWGNYLDGVRQMIQSIEHNDSNQCLMVIYFVET